MTLWRPAGPKIFANFHPGTVVEPITRGGDLGAGARSRKRPEPSVARDNFQRADASLPVSNGKTIDKRPPGTVGENPLDAVVRGPAQPPRANISILGSRSVAAARRSE